MEDPKMQVILFVSGRNLKDLDTFSKSDPRCVVKEIVGGPAKAQ
jgi:hypothetical protein